MAVAFIHAWIAAPCLDSCPGLHEWQASALLMFDLTPVQPLATTKSIFVLRLVLTHPCLVMGAVPRCRSVSNMGMAIACGTWPST